jgi:hypothetical protein
MSDWDKIMGPYRNRESKEVTGPDGKVIGRLYTYPCPGMYVWEPAPPTDACTVDEDGDVIVKGHDDPVGHVSDPQGSSVHPTSRLGKRVVNEKGEPIGWVITGKDGSTSYQPFGKGLDAVVDPDGTIRAFGSDPNKPYGYAPVAKTTPPPKPEVKPESKQELKPKPESKKPTKKGRRSKKAAAALVGAGLVFAGTALIGHLAESSHADNAPVTVEPSGQTVVPPAVGNDANAPVGVTTTTAAVSDAQEHDVVVPSSTPATTVPLPSGPTTTMPRPTPASDHVATPTTVAVQPSPTTTVPEREQRTPPAVIQLGRVPAHLPQIGDSVAPVGSLRTKG